MDHSARDHELRARAVERERTAAAAVPPELRAAAHHRATPRALLDGLDAIVWEMDPATRQFTFVSDGAERMLGYPAEQWVREPRFWEAHLHPDDRARAVAFCDDAVRGGRDHEVEYRMVAADGHAVWLRDLVHVVTRDGVAAELHGVMVDVTRQKRLEAELRASEERFARFAEASIDGVVAHAAGRIVDVNTTGAAMLGYAPEELIGRSILDVTLPEEHEVLLAHIASGSTAPIEGHALTKDGAAIPVELRGRDVTAGGAPSRIVIVRDISDRRKAEQAIRESEERYRRLVEAMVDGVCVHVDGRFVFANDAAARLLGARDPESLVGRDVIDFVEPALRPRASEALLRFTAEGRPVPFAEYRLLRLDGTLLDVELSATTLEFGGQRAVQVVCRDISERKRAEAALRDVELQLRQSQKLEAVGRLAGGIAHDFNNLLTVITAYTQMVVQELPVADPRRTDLVEVERAAKRAADLTRQLLAFSRKQVLQPVVLDLNDVVRDVEKMLRRLIGEDVRLRATLAAGGARVRADRGQLEQVLLNLVVNSRDAMPEGGEVAIDTDLVEVGADAAQRPGEGVAPGRYARLRVSDTGVGMDEAVRAHAFEPFFTTKPEGTGTGLGLSTVYGIVKQSGGHVVLDSAPGRGTTFTLYFPAVGTPSSTEPSRAEDAGARGAETILLVEDEEAVRDVARRMLASRGYTVLAARHAAEALDVARANHGRIDLLLTDLVMPGMGGRELAARLAADHPAMRVLFISGYSADDAARRGIHEPASAVLAKPFSTETLATRVRDALDRRG